MIPEKMEHKYNCDNVKTEDLCDVYTECVGCPYDGCFPDCPQCMWERWAKWTLENVQPTGFIDIRDIVALKDMAGGK